MSIELLVIDLAGGGGNTFAPKFGWQKEYAKTLKTFTQKAKEKLEILAQTP